ncbi:MAG: carbon-nitrogen hydrolase [Bryobacteraceae bacterium]
MPAQHPIAPIGLVQMACGADPNENLEKARWRIREAAARGAQLVCLPELFRTRYFCREENPEWFALAEPVPGPTTETLGALARELGVTIVAPLFERRAPGLYHNSAAVILPDGSLAGLYRKMHIPHDPLYFEKYYFAPGDNGFCVFVTPIGRIAVLICWDQWFPEAARLAALAGATLILYPTAIGWHPSERHSEGAAQLDAWLTIQRAHAIANGVYVAAINRTGREGPPGQDIEFWGSSFVTDPFGRLLAQAPPDGEATLVVELDPRLVEETRRHWPFLRDRRTDAYRGLLERWLDR